MTGETRTGPAGRVGPPSAASPPRPSAPSPSASPPKPSAPPPTEVAEVVDARAVVAPGEPALPRHVPATLPQWWEPLRARAATVRVEDITRSSPPVTGGRESAVLVLLGESGHGGPGEAVHPGLEVLLLQRAAGLRTHAGQVAFPGGAVDETDRDATATALREAQEEVGVEPDSVTVVARLPKLWIPVSGYLVTPVLAWWHTPHPVYPRDPVEVARVARLPVSRLVDPANRLRVRHPNGHTGPAFQVDDLLVWGFTGMVLAALLELAGWACPWPQDRVVDLSEPPDGAVL